MAHYQTTIVGAHATAIPLLLVHFQAIASIEERKEDLPDLIRVFLNRINANSSGDPIEFEALPSDLVDHLMRDGINGNIRGLDNDLQRVIVFCPRDSHGKPLLSAWKTLLGVSKRYIPNVQQGSNVLTLEQFVNIQTDFIRPGFTGLPDVKEMLEKKLLMEAAKKLKTVTARAEVLKIDLGTASRKFAALKQESAKTEPRKAPQARKDKDVYGTGNESAQIENDRA